MSKVVLYSARACPFAHRTRLVLAEKRVAFELLEVDLQNKPQRFLDVSAYGKVPAISHGENHLWESAVVNEYLDEVFKDPPLQPESAVDRARARIWVDYANTRFVGPFGALLRGEAGPQEFEAVLAYIEREGLAKSSQGGPFFFGARPGLVDFAFYPWFERLPALQHYREFALPKTLTRLHAWQEAVRGLASVKEQASPTEFYVERYARYGAPDKSNGDAQRAARNQAAGTAARSTP